LHCTRSNASVSLRFCLSRAGRVNGRAHLRRLKEDARALREVYEGLAEDARRESVAPTAEWLLDNFHIISAATRDIHHDLRQLPPSTGAFGRTLYRVTVTNPEHRCRGVQSAEIDGVSVDPLAIPLRDDGKTHDVAVVLGKAGPVGVGPQARHDARTARQFPAR